MSTVLPFEKREQHLSGAAFCMQCDSTWTAVAPVGTVELECPTCHTHKGLFKFPAQTAEPEIWTCKCDNQLFNVTPRGIFCPNCGVYQEFP